MYPWNNSYLFDNTRTPQTPAYAYRPLPHHSLHAMSYLIANTGEVTFHLLPKVIHLVNASRREYDSWSCSITSQRVITEKNQEKKCEQEIEIRNPNLKKGGAK